MWQRFSGNARKAVFYAQESAQQVGDSFVSEAHLLLGLLRESDMTSCKILVKLGVPIGKLRDDVRARIGTKDSIPSADMTLTVEAKHVIDLAYASARALNHNYIGTAHLLMGLAQLDSKLIADIFADHLITFPRVAEAAEAVPRPNASGATVSESLGPKLVRRERLLPMLVGACLHHHLFLALLGCGQDKYKKVGEQIIALMFAHARKGLQAAEPESLDGLLDIAYEVAGTEALSWQHLMAAIIRTTPEFSGLLEFGDLTPESRSSGVQAFSGPAAFLFGSCLTYHLVLNMVADTASAANPVISAQCDDLGGLQFNLWDQIVRHSQSPQNVTDSDLVLRLLWNSRQVAGNSRVRSSHILLAIFEEGRTPCSEVLREYGVTPERSRELVLNT